MDAEVASRFILSRMHDAGSDVAMRPSKADGGFEEDGALSWPKRGRFGLTPKRTTRR